VLLELLGVQLTLSVVGVAQRVGVTVVVGFVAATPGVWSVLLRL
jgi:hypothetical protein